MLSRLLVGVLIGAAALPGPAAASPAAAPAKKEAATITLITGDTVALTKIDQRYAATVRPAPGREGVTFHTLETDGGLREATFGIVGDNLLDERIRNHISFKKAEVLQPGLGVRLFTNVRF